jgi:formylglycine-generating enzyme required for sulfatase activity
MTGMANCDPDAMPEHAVTLAAFALDASEVSQRDYKACVDAGGCCASTTSDCPAPVQLDADLDLPIRDLTWGAAREYCSFAGKHLPTEAQWERAARMGDHPYPWGDDAADCSRAIGAGCNGPRDVTDGAGPPFDLLGNVAEWVQDEYNATFYTTSPAMNPLDDAGGNIRVIRGGGFTTAAADFAVWRRDHDDRYHHAGDLGFRCAR